MFPVLVKFGPVKIYTYGLLVAAGFYVGILIARYEAGRKGLDPQKVMDLCFAILIAAVVGSRLMYVLTDLETYLQKPLDILRIWKGGLVFYGGFIAASLAAVVFLKKHKLPLWQTADIFAPALAAGHVLGRVGCFFAGCCYGKVCHAPWAVTFTNTDSLAPVGIPLHPTQLYHMGFNLSIFAVLWLLRRRFSTPGRLFWLYVLLYALTRSLVEFFRGDFRGGQVFGVLSISQTIGIVTAVVAVAMWIALRERDNGKTS